MFQLTAEIKHRFAKEIINSSKEGLEHLVILYSDKNGKLSTSETIIGTEYFCEWYVPAYEEDKKMIGDFHTHPFLKKIKDISEGDKKKTGRKYINIDTFISHMTQKYKSIYPFSKEDLASTLVPKINRNIDRITCVGCDLDINNVPCAKINNDLFKRDKGIIIQTFENILRDKRFEDVDDAEFQEAMKKYFYIGYFKMAILKINFEPIYVVERTYKSRWCGSYGPGRET